MLGLSPASSAASALREQVAKDFMTVGITWGLDSALDPEERDCSISFFPLAIRSADQSTGSSSQNSSQTEVHGK